MYIEYSVMQSDGNSFKIDFLDKLHIILFWVQYRTEENIFYGPVIPCTITNYMSVFSG